MDKALEESSWLKPTTFFQNAYSPPKCNQWMKTYSVIFLFPKSPLHYSKGALSYFVSRLLSLFFPLHCWFLPSSHLHYWCTEWVLGVWALHISSLLLHLFAFEDKSFTEMQNECLCTFLPGVRLFCDILQPSLHATESQNCLDYLLTILAKIKNQILLPAWSPILILLDPLAITRVHFLTAFTNPSYRSLRDHLLAK